MSEMGTTGVVVRATGMWYEVLSEGQTVQCRLRGKLRLNGVRSTSPVVVGDVVSLEKDDSGEWAITSISPRRNYIIRRASNLSKESHIIGANIDLALIVATIVDPVTSREFIDRMLVSCEAYKIPAVILVGKFDLLSSRSDDVDDFIDAYAKAGYRTLPVSTKTHLGIKEVKQLVAGKTTIIIGNSGVGKSSLVKELIPDADAKTGDISKSFHKGKHTTTFSTMYLLPEGGFLIDSPGIKGFGLIDIEDKEVAHYFPEMMGRLDKCRFYNCTHTHEPGCAIEEAVKNGEIAFSRYESYLKILDEDEKYRK